MDKPEALRLADELEEAAGDYWRFQKSTGYGAAAELRRLSAVEAQRDALLEALKEITPSICHVSIVPEEKCAQCGRIARARAAIKAVEESKTFLGEE